MQNTHSIPNPRYRVAKRWLWAGLFFLGCAFIPAVVEMDMMRWGFGTIVLLGFFAMMGFIGAAVYWSLGRCLGPLLRGEGIIATWRTPEEEWKKFVEEDFVRELEQKRSLWKLLAGISCAVWLLCSFGLKDGWWIVGLTLLPLLLLTYILAEWGPRSTRNQRLRVGGITVIGREAALSAGDVFQWAGAGARLERVEGVEDEGVDYLRIVASYPARHGRSEQELRIPLPQGGEIEAEKVARMLWEAQEAKQAKTAGSNRGGCVLLVLVIFGVLGVVLPRVLDWIEPAPSYSYSQSAQPEANAESVFDDLPDRVPNSLVEEDKTMDARPLIAPEDR
jgi:hypothetical protein